MPDVVANSHPTPAKSVFGLIRPGGLILLALGLGLAFEVFFYDRRPGLSIFLWFVLGVVAALAAAAIERTPVSRGAAVLLLPLLALAGMTFLRLEPLTIVLDIVLALGLFALVARLIRHDQLADMGWLDLAWALVGVPLEAWIRPWPVVGDLWARRVRERGSRRIVFSVLRGLALALPVVVIFGVLLGGADLVFGDYLEAALRWLNLELLVDWASRGAVIALVGLFCLGILVVAYRPQGPRRLFGKDRPLVAPFLGFTEAAVILGAVDVLFMGFVAVQFAYLFGGEANIDAAGYTYAEYARRGFGELVAVALLSLGMIYALAAVTRRVEPRPRRAFAGLSALLVVLVGVILVSAYQRLVLYESAYGFSRLRTYTHVALVWLGIAFAAFLILLLVDRLRLLAPVGLALALGFSLSLDGVNVDAFIVKRNTQRLAQSGEIDVGYLLQLSDDAVPGLVDLARLGTDEIRADLLPQLACRRAALRRVVQDQTWLSSHASQTAALRALEGLAEWLDAYRVLFEYHGESKPRWPIYVVMGPDGTETCRFAWD